MAFCQDIKASTSWIKEDEAVPRGFFFLPGGLGRLSPRSSMDDRRSILCYDVIEMFDNYRM